MTEKLEAKLVAEELRKHGGLSEGELDDVKRCKTSAEAAECLLLGLLDTTSIDGYDRFLESLKATNQAHIFLWLIYKDYNIDSENTDFIRREYTYFMGTLNAELRYWLTDRSNRDCWFDDWELISRIRCVDEYGDRDGINFPAETLLVALSRKLVKLDRILYSLDRYTGNDGVANELRRRLQSADSQRT